MNDNILIVEDDPTFAATLQRALRRRGIEAHVAATADAVLQAVANVKPGRIVLDLNLAGASGLNLIPRLLELNPEARIVVLTGYASITTAVDAIKLGAVQYLAKPVDVPALLRAFGHALDGGAESAAQEAAPIAATPMSVDRVEWEHIQRVLREHNGNISSTARALNMHRRTLQRKLLKRPAKH